MNWEFVRRAEHRAKDANRLDTARKSLRELLEKQKIAARAAGNYDCIVPISGGKDSAFQLHVLTKVYGLKPLAVTHSHNWFSEAGWWNLGILLKMDVDHILYTPKRSLVNRMARKSLCLIGDSCYIVTQA